MEYLENIFSNPQLDIPVYFCMGAIGTLLFLIRILIMLILGVDDGGDFDTDTGDMGHDSGGFSLFSLLSIVAFMMGAGWFGFAARTEWGWNPIISAILAATFGFSLMLLSSAGMWYLKKFNEPGKYDITKTVGRTGRVYLSIPGHGEGTGQVEMNVDGRRAILQAKSSGATIESFTTVKVLEVQDGDIVLVERI